MNGSNNLETLRADVTIQRAKELARLKLENRALKALKDSLESQALGPFEWVCQNVRFKDEDCQVVVS